MTLKTERLFYGRNGIKQLPAEELENLLDLLAVTDALDSLGVRLAAHVTVTCSRLVDRVLELELLDNLGRTKVENLIYLLGDESIIEAVLCCAISVYEYTDRSCDTDCVSELDENFISDACCNKILGDVTCGIGS